MSHTLDRKSSTNLAQRLEKLRAQDLSALEQDMASLPEPGADAHPFCAPTNQHTIPHQRDLADSHWTDGQQRVATWPCDYLTLRARGDVIHEKDIELIRTMFDFPGTDKRPAGDHC